CLPRGREKPRQVVYGHMYVMIGLREANRRRLFGSPTLQIANQNIRKNISHASAERFKPMRFLGSIDSTKRVASLKPRVGPTSVASSMTCSWRTPRRSRRKLWIASRPYTESRKRFAAGHPMTGDRSVGLELHHCWIPCTLGSNSP